MMIVAGWWLHCVMIATVLSAGAVAWEMAARWTGRPARWSWFVALAASVTLPWLLRLLPERVLPEAVASVPVLTLDPITVSQATSAPALGAGDAALLLWLASSVAMLAYLGVMLVRLARARRGWSAAQLEGGPVWVTRAVGPAAVGFTGEVVVPQWALELDDELRRLLLLHEREHVHARDPRLLLVSLALLSLMPWNPVLWLQVLRLRNAIELDCDARVLRTGANPRVYGSLLLEVGSRRSTSALVMATFAEPRIFLEERIRRIARWPQQRRPLRAVLFALLALVLFGTAASARDPLRMSPADVLGDVVPAGFNAVDTPPRHVVGVLKESVMTKRPLLQNRNDVAVAFRRIGAEAQQATINEAARLWLQLDAAGRVQQAVVVPSTGSPATDAALIEAGKRMRFSPAENNGRAIGTWLQLPPFTEPIGVRELTAQQDTPPRMQPRMTVRPQMLNKEDVRRALEESYPPLLRDAGIGGVAKLAIYLDEAGVPQRVQLTGPSGYPAIDEAALRIGSLMRFSPYMEDARKVPHWIEIPLAFGKTLERQTPRAGVTVIDGFSTGESAPPPPPPPPVRIREPAAPLMTVDGQLLEQPYFTPMTVRPELLNRDEVGRVLVQNYPPVLRDAGIGGTPVLWFYIDENGAVTKLQVSKSSGYPALDDAAMRVGRTMRFAPALNREARVPVWVEIPVSFQAK